MIEHPAIINPGHQEESADKMIVLRLTKRVQELEDLVNKLGPADMLFKRIKHIEDYLFTNKEILSLEEASAFLDASKSQLYKLTRTFAIPHYKPGGKAIYFYKSEVVEWVKQHPIKQAVKNTARSNSIDNVSE